MISVASLRPLGSEDVAVVFALVDGCGAVLANHPPQLQGAAIGELLSRWLSGWQVTPTERESLLLDVVELVRDLNKVNVEIFAAHNAVPPDQQH